MLSTPPVNPLASLGERKAWGRAIAGRLYGPNGSPPLGACSTAVDPLTRAEIAAKLLKIQSCGNVVELRSKAAGPIHLHNYQKCGQTAVCPICAARAQAMRSKRYAGPITALAAACGRDGRNRIEKRSKWPGFAHDDFSGLNAYLLTATIRPAQSLRDGLKSLMGGWKAFRRMGQRRAKGRSKGEFGKVVAALAKIEIKRGSGSGLWHPHIHALVFTSEPLDYRTFAGPQLFLDDVQAADELTGEVPQVLLSKISFEWLEATKGQGYNIRCDNMRKFWEQNHKPKGMDFVESVKKQSQEVLKYATKWNADPKSGTADFDGGDFVEVVRTTYCRRLFATYGQFRNLPGNDFVGNDSGETLSKFDNEPPAIFESRYIGGAYSTPKQIPAALFADSDPMRPLIPWDYGNNGEIICRENPRREYLRAVARINGAWRKRRGTVLRMRDDRARQYDVRRGVEWLLNRAKAAARRDLFAVRGFLYLDMGPPNEFARRVQSRIAAKALADYEASQKYWDDITAAFMEVLQAPSKIVLV